MSHKLIRERGSVLYLGMAQEFGDFAMLAIYIMTWINSIQTIRNIL